MPARALDRRSTPAKSISRAENDGNECEMSDETASDDDAIECRATAPSDDPHYFKPI